MNSSDTQNKIILYTTADGKVTADVFFANDTFWLTQRTMAELFGINIPSVSRGCMVVLLGEDHAASLISMLPDKCP